MTRRTKADWIAEGRRIERSDTLAHMDATAAACARSGERGDDGAKLLGQRLSALRDGLNAGIHVGDADNG
jgi:hypothetical protein